MGLHPSDILIGYEKASKKFHEEYEKQVVYTCEDTSNFEDLLKCMKGSIASKQYGLEDLIGGLITEAC